MKRLLTTLSCILAYFLCQSQVIRIGSMVYPAGIAPNLITVSTNSLTSFSTPQGTASTSQTFTASGVSLVAGVTITAPTGYEVSTDNSTFTGSLTLGQSGGTLVGQPVTVYTRITSSATAGSVNGNLTASSTSATTKVIGLSGTVTSTSPSLSVSTNSLSAFSNTTGTPSTSQSFTVSGSNLTANALATPPSGFEVSGDNTTFQSSLTITQSAGNLTGQPVTIYTRVAGATAAGSYSGNIVLSSTGATNKNVAVNATVSSAGGASVAKFNFTLDNSGTTATGWTKFFGDNKTNLSFTDAGTGWILQTIGANWVSFAGTIYGSNSDGASAGTFGATFPAAVIAGNYYNSGVHFSSGNYGFHIDNLPTGNYTIQIVGSIKSTVNSGITMPEYHVQFGTSTDQVQSTMNNQDNTGNPNTTTHVLSFTGNVTSGQSLSFGVFAPTTNIPGAGCINAVIITKN